MSWVGVGAPSNRTRHFLCVMQIIGIYAQVIVFCLLVFSVRLPRYANLLAFAFNTSDEMKA